ncbi:hypothetical protein H920_14448 [Fukomys damarensis]|uniref:Uncharacterized protein n=1 Tax=Fukomys damarensis TaxID=885580 RepID=A0A091DN10_FUKDA|nr:hypothetical protein H920_14448 [Fukomys damarensis]
MASLFKKKTVDGECQAGLTGPSSAFLPKSFEGFWLRFWLWSLGAGLDRVAPQVTALATSLLCFPGSRTSHLRRTWFVWVLPPVAPLPPLRQRIEEAGYL